MYPKTYTKKWKRYELENMYGDELGTVMSPFNIT